MDAVAVPAEFAHKADHRNMWITGAEPGEGASVVFGFRIPDTVRPGIAEYVEVQRQATHAFAHLQLEVPLGSRAMLSTAELLLEDRPGSREALPRVGRVAVQANIDGRAARGIADIDVGIRFVAAPAVPGDLGGGANPGDGAGRIGAGRIVGKYLPQGLYDRIRGSAARNTSVGDGGGSAAGSGLATVAGGSTAGAGPNTDPAVDASRSATPVVEELTVDVENPILRDHETDHVSGMVVVCAAERLARQYFGGRGLRGLVTRFFSFIEKAEPAHVVLHESDGGLRVTVVQRGVPCAQVDGVLDDGEPGEETR